MQQKFGIFIAAILCLLSVSAVAQNISITGTVIDDRNTPLNSVSIILKGSTVGTVSNADGQYTVQAPANGTLIFSYVGMTTQEIPVEGQSRIDVIMLSTATELEDVVVIGYGTLQKKQVTSAITSISAKDLVAGVGGSTIANAMKGKVSNLVMSGTDSPNSGNDFQLRGMASVNTSRSPLIVIDGMPGGDIRSIVQEDIQSIDILKDASAGAIYGTRATGGVILITTKKAREGRLSASYTGEATYKNAFGKPEMLSRKEYLRNFDKAIDHDADVDWWDEGLTENPLSQRHLLTVQGGSENAKIYATMMYEKNIGILKGDQRKDYSGRVNLNFKILNGWVDINSHLDYRQANRDDSKPDINILLALNPTRSPYDRFSATGYNIWTNATDTPNTIGDAALNTRNTLDKWFRPDAEVVFNILPVKGLSLHVSGGYENRQAESHNYDSRFSTAELRAGRKGSATLNFSKTDLFNSDTYLSFVRTVGEHTFNAVAGYNYYQRDAESFGMTNRDFSVDGIKFWDIGSGTWLKEGDADMKSRKDITEKLSAMFGRVNYTWQGKYMAAASLRREGSSKFAVNKRYGLFWSLSAGWRVTNEKFMEDLNWVNDLKLRAGYGVTGNEGFSANYANVMYASDLFWMMPSGGWESTYGLSRNINPDLGWEEKHEWNIGLDYSLFNDRLFGKIDFYRRNIEGLIYEVNVPQPPNVHNKMHKNIGTLENRGWEVEIGGRIVRNKNWDYETSVNFSHNVTTVGKIFGDNTYFENGYIYPENTHRFQEGVTVGSFFLHQHGGFILNPDGETSDFLIKDVYGDPVEVSKGTNDDKKYTGNYTPTVIGGWSHNLRYKNLQFNMTLTSWIDFDIFNAIELYNGYAPRIHGSDQTNKLKAAFERNKGIRPYGTLPVSDYFLEDGSFLKIQNISLSYTLRTKRYVNVLDNIRFYLTVNNVFTFTKYSGHNPEVNITGWENGIEDKIYPQTRTYALGVQFNF